MTMHSSRRVAGRYRGGTGEIQGRSRGDYLDDAQQQARGREIQGRYRGDTVEIYRVLVAVEYGGVHAPHQPRLVRAGELRVS